MNDTTGQSRERNFAMYDVIVVGARVAGSPTAMLLARKGYRVLLLDKATFPSETLSTHMITVAGSAQLRRWGLLDKVEPRIARRVPIIYSDFSFATSAPL